jgi:hypothetical protein
MTTNTFSKKPFTLSCEKREGWDSGSKTYKNLIPLPYENFLQLELSSNFEDFTLILDSLTSYKGYLVGCLKLSDIDSQKYFYINVFKDGKEDKQAIDDLISKLKSNNGLFILKPCNSNGVECQSLKDLIELTEGYCFKNVNLNLSKSERLSEEIVNHIKIQIETGTPNQDAISSNNETISLLQSNYSDTIKTLGLMFYYPKFLNKEILPKIDCSEYFKDLEAYKVSDKKSGNKSYSSKSETDKANERLKFILENLNDIKKVSLNLDCSDYEATALLLGVSVFVNAFPFSNPNSISKPSFDVSELIQSINEVTEEAIKTIETEKDENLDLSHLLMWFKLNPNDFSNPVTPESELIVDCLKNEKNFNFELDDNAEAYAKVLDSIASIQIQKQSLSANKAPTKVKAKILELGYGQNLLTNNLDSLKSLLSALIAES